MWLPQRFFFAAAFFAGFFPNGTNPGFLPATFFAGAFFATFFATICYLPFVILPNKYLRTIPFAGVTPCLRLYFTTRRFNTIP